MNQPVFPKPHFSRGWYALDEATIQVVMEAVLFPETLPKEAHYQYDQAKMKASPVIDKTALLGAALDLCHDLWHRLTLAEDQIRQLQGAVKALQHGVDLGSDQDPGRVGEEGMPR